MQDLLKVAPFASLDKRDVYDSLRDKILSSEFMGVDSAGGADGKLLFLKSRGGAPRTPHLEMGFSAGRGS